MLPIGAGGGKDLPAALSGAVVRGLGPALLSVRLSRTAALNRREANDNKPRLIHLSPWRDGWPTAPCPVNSEADTVARYW